MQAMANLHLECSKLMPACWILDILHFLEQSGSTTNLQDPIYVERACSRL